MGVAIVLGASAAAIQINARKESRRQRWNWRPRPSRDKALAAEGVATQREGQSRRFGRRCQTPGCPSTRGKDQGGCFCRTKPALRKVKPKSDRDRAQDAKAAEEYQAYVARIGLAAAQIDGNAFDTAEQLLNDCPPQLRNWEWGRLRFLSTQSVRDFSADAPVDSVAFDHDGKQFVSGSWDGKARVWDIASGKTLLTIPYGGLYVHAVAFSPDGQLIATGGNDKKGFVKIWNAKTGALVQTLVGHTDDVLTVAFSHDGRRLLTASYDKTARLWDIASGKELRRVFGSQLVGLVGRLLARRIPNRHRQPRRHGYRLVDRNR